MDSRRKKKPQQSKRTSRGSKIKSDESVVETLPKPDPTSFVLDELLRNLLAAVTTSFEINKSFVRLTFFNLNSYCGWLGPNGFHGFGTYNFADGSSYKGNFEDGLTSGQGKYKYAMGYLYEGNFQAGRRHGYGQYKTRRFNYEGHFKNGKFHGEGVWKSKSNEKKGTFFEGKITHGVVRDSSGTFEGTFDESDLRQRGKFTFKNGNTYEGSWSDDLFWGYGVYNWVNDDICKTKAETKYIGYWLNGERYAVGMLTFRQRYIVCQWNCDRKSGAGMIIACNGNCYASMDMFTEDQYNGSVRIKLCDETREILEYLLQLTTPAVSCETMEDKCNMLRKKIQELIDSHAECFSPIYPIRIPHYEIASLPAPYDTPSEISCMQQVLIENYADFMKLYKKYTHPNDEYMNILGLNLFYMDVFCKVRDVTIDKNMMTGPSKIRHQCVFYDQKESYDCILAPVTFYEFFHHFIQVTQIFMENEKLRRSAERMKPTFFGRLAIQVLIVFRMIQGQELPNFLVREGLRVNRPAIVSLLQSMKSHTPGNNTIRSAYAYLYMKNAVSGKSLNFIQAVKRFSDKIFRDNVLIQSYLKFSDLELVEIVLYSCQLKLAKEDMVKNKQLVEQMKQNALRELSSFVQ